MKKVFMTLVALIVATTTFAQTSSGSFQFDESRLYFGARLGLSAAGVTDAGSKAGLTLGGVVGLRVSDSVPVFLESGLSYTQRGGKEAGTTLGLNYLEIPVLIKYGIPVADGIHVLPLIGPYFSYAVSGRIKNSDTTPNIDMSSFRDGLYKHPDMGIKVGCGAEYNNLYLELAYKFGIANISDNSAVTSHGHAFTVEFGVNF